METPRVKTLEGSPVSVRSTLGKKGGREVYVGRRQKLHSGKVPVVLLGTLPEIVSLGNYLSTPPHPRPSPRRFRPTVRTSKSQTSLVPSECLPLTPGMCMKGKVEVPRVHLHPMPTGPLRSKDLFPVGENGDYEKTLGTGTGRPFFPRKRDPPPSTTVSRRTLCLRSQTEVTRKSVGPGPSETVDGLFHP